MRPSFVPATCRVAVFGLTAICATGAPYYSRHCDSDNSPTENKIINGPYRGTWEYSVTFTQLIEGQRITQTVRAAGEFTLEVNRGESPATDPASAGSSPVVFEGTANTSTTMSGMATTQSLTGSARLKLVEATDAMIVVRGKHQIAGQIRTLRSPPRQQAFSDEIEIGLFLERAECLGAYGHVLCAPLQDMTDSMRKAGYTVLPGANRWSITRTDDAGKRLEQLREELRTKPAPAGIVRTRTTESNRLGRIADRIREQEPPGIRECMLELWLEHIRAMVEAWSVEDAARLGASPCNEPWPVLSDLIREAVATCRSLELLGVDECNQHIHETLWRAIQRVLMRRLELEVEGDTPLESLHTVLYHNEVAGSVSPALEAEARAELLKRAAHWAHLTFTNFMTVLKAARASGMTEEEALKDKIVGAACRRADRAAAIAILEGVESPEMRQWQGIK